MFFIVWSGSFLFLACVHACSIAQCLWLFVIPWTVSCQAPLSMGFPRQEYWSGLPFPSLGDLSDPGIRHMSLVSPVQAGRFFTTEPPGKAPIPSLLEIFLFLIVIHRCYILSNFFLCQLVWSYDFSSLAYWYGELYWLIFFLFFFNFTVLYWFCHTSTCICHGCTRAPHPEPPSHLPPHPISLSHPSAPAPSFLYPASNLDWWFVSYMILYMF